MISNGYGNDQTWSRRQKPSGRTNFEIRMCKIDMRPGIYALARRGPSESPPVIQHTNPAIFHFTAATQQSKLLNGQNHKKGLGLSNCIKHGPGKLGFKCRLVAWTRNCWRMCKKKSLTALKLEDARINYCAAIYFRNVSHGTFLRIF